MPHIFAPIHRFYSNGRAILCWIIYANFLPSALRLSRPRIFRHPLFPHPIFVPSKNHLLEMAKFSVWKFRNISPIINGASQCILSIRSSSIRSGYVCVCVCVESHVRSAWMSSREHRRRNIARTTVRIILIHGVCSSNMHACVPCRKREIERKWENGERANKPSRLRKW